jgi:hypothetical protein
MLGHGRDSAWLQIQRAESAGDLVSHHNPNRGKSLAGFPGFGVVVALSDAGGGFAEREVNTSRFVVETHHAGSGLFSNANLNFCG